MNKPFAILKLTDLKVVQFDHEDERDEAVQTFYSKGVEVVVLIWSDAAHAYHVLVQV